MSDGLEIGVKSLSDHVFIVYKCEGIRDNTPRYFAKGGHVRNILNHIFVGLVFTWG